MSQETVQVFTSQTDAYHHAFKIFLDHTDQKVRARKRLVELVTTLDTHETFIDSGAGNGQVTSWLIGNFERTIAIEPNPSLRKELKKTCPAAEIIKEPITKAELTRRANFVLCSHVFYYIDRNQWMNNLETLVSWLSSDGMLVLILQNEETDCMNMIEYFHGERFQLRYLADQFRKKHQKQYEVQVETVPSHVVTSDFKSAYTIAEFMLNLLPITAPPRRETLENYTRTHFTDDKDMHRFSCHQDFLCIRPR